MEFSRMGQHTIKCLITEEEIFDMGFSLDDIMSNGEKTQEFMNIVFDMAEEKFQTKFDLGVKTVRADFLPNHTISLTFSEHPSSQAMMEHLKDVLNGFLNSLPAEKWEELKKDPTIKNATEELEKIKIIVRFRFEDMDIVTRFAKQVSLPEIPFNALYKYNSKYYLIMDLSNCNEQEVLKLSMLTDEYATEIQVGAEKKAFLDEHGDIILKEKAIESLKQL